VNVNINGTHYVLAALRELLPHCKFYVAGSSEMFGNANEVQQKESTGFQPRSAWDQFLIMSPRTKNLDSNCSLSIEFGAFP
jgi:GDP-D-mannose dehydratase